MQLHSDVICIALYNEVGTACYINASPLNLLSLHDEDEQPWSTDRGYLWSLLLMDIRNLGSVTSALPDSPSGIGYLEGEVGHRKFHSLDEKQRRTL
ncbi:hypothetical protein EVAR_84097_1 [Eumeta japonica]|uniref:Uncharacterized protein n=1 Tax=Eumeta variegata TaxID=151549 RepID=A0A4C1UYT0_EUMVA|nr:hypothetical protein EVAR_84097_1 [Eumeta japonica]